MNLIPLNGRNRLEVFLNESYSVRCNNRKEITVGGRGSRSNLGQKTKLKLAKTIDMLEARKANFEIRDGDNTHFKYPVFKLAGMKIKKYEMKRAKDGTIYVFVYQDKK